MPTFTSYKKLEKPLSTEKYNIAVANKNNDVIDSELHKLDLKNESQDNLLATKEALLQDAINNEEARALNSENSINDSLTDEINRATTSEQNIIDTINANRLIWDDKYTKNEIDNKFSTLETNIDWKESVESFDDIAITYPDPDDGWTVNVNDTDITYRFNGEEWISISANAIPKSTDDIDGLLSKEDHQKLNLSYEHAQKSHSPADAEKNIIVGIQKNGEDLEIQGDRKVNIEIPDGELNWEEMEKTDSIDKDDLILLNQNNKNKAITAENLMKGMNRYLPKGTKILTKEFTVSNNADTEFNICNISDFGVMDVTNVIDINVTCVNIAFNIWYNIHPSGDISGKYFSNIPFTNYIFKVSLIVKDFSEIGSEIVTENVKMITVNKVVNITNNICTNVIPYEELTEITGGKDNIVGVNIYGATSTAGVSMVPYFYANKDLALMTLSNTNMSNVEVTISLFVRVPVVEQLPKFTKDVEVTLKGSDSIRILDLDGTEECGGYTEDNIKFITALAIGRGAELCSPVIAKFPEDNFAGIYIFSPKNLVGPCKIRIHIE